MRAQMTRRRLLGALGVGAVAAGVSSTLAATEAAIPGFEKEAGNEDSAQHWRPISDRKVRVGLVGNGYCRFAGQFGFQHHPNVEVVAVSDLVPERCADLARTTRCTTSYPSLEKLLLDNTVEAVFIATDAPSHAAHCLATLRHGKHVACAVPACFGSLEDADRLFDGVKTSGLVFMMFETSCFHRDLHAMRQLHDAGVLGKIVYAEGEYYHFMPEPLDSFKGWRVGLPPQWYATHANAYLVGVSGGSFTEVSCRGVTSAVPHLMPANNPYKNPFGTEVAVFRTSDGGVARMAVSWDTAGQGGETGRVRGQHGSFDGTFHGPGHDVPLDRPPLPPGLEPGSHGGSHGHLTNEFIAAILERRRPLIDVAQALNMTVAGIVAHQSALRDGEVLKIPQYRLES